MPVYKNPNKKTKDGRQWYYRFGYTDNQGQYREKQSRMFSTRKEALQAEAMEKQAIIRPTSSITIEQAVHDFLAVKSNEVKPQTLPKTKILCRHIVEAIGKIKIDKLTIEIYERFKDGLKQKGFSVPYLNKIHRTMIAILKTSRKRHGVYNDVPEICGGFKCDTSAKKEMRFYTLEQFNQYIQVVDDIQWKAFFTALFYCGLRCGEANALTWRKIEFDKNILKIDQTVETKMKGPDGGYLITSPKTKTSIRTIAMPRKAREALLELKDHYRRFDSFCDDWFVFGGIRPLPQSTIGKKNEDFAKAAGLEKIRIHDFRHSCASLLIFSGAKITVVARYLGHSDVAMTLNTYSHLYPSDMEEAIKNIDEKS